MDRNAKLAALVIPVLLLAALAWWQFGDLPAPTGPDEENAPATPQSLSTEKKA